jgi:hypothetical protein
MPQEMNAVIRLIKSCTYTIHLYTHSVNFQRGHLNKTARNLRFLEVNQPGDVSCKFVYRMTSSVMED